MTWFVTLGRRKTPVEPEERILSVICENGEMEQGKLPKATDFSYRTILKKLKILEKKKLVIVVRTEPRIHVTILHTIPSGQVRQKTIKILKGGKEKKIYSATLKGLCKALVDSEKIRLQFLQQPDSFIKKWSDLFPFLNKYALFKKHGLERFFREQIMDHARQFSSGKINPNYTDALENRVIVDAEAQTWKADFLQKWDKVLFEDSDLRKKALHRVKQKVGMSRAYVTDAEIRLSKIFPELERPDPDWEEINKVERGLDRKYITRS